MQDNVLECDNFIQFIKNNTENNFCHLCYNYPATLSRQAFKFRIGGAFEFVKKNNKMPLETKYTDSDVRAFNFISILFTYFFKYGAGFSPHTGTLKFSLNDRETSFMRHLTKLLPFTFSFQWATLNSSLGLQGKVLVTLIRIESHIILHPWGLRTRRA